MSGNINEDIIEEIKSRCNIVDIIGRYVNLKRAGINHKGLCPFHGEKTPSFVVSEDKQIFTCFGCGATGDVIEFVKRIENLDFYSTVSKLAEEFGVEIKAYSGYMTENRKNALYDINRNAALFFYNNFSHKNNKGTAYMKSRNIEFNILKKFGIGFADESWNSLYNYLVSKGTDVKDLIELGLISFSNNKYYDKYRNRVIFPIINTRGKIIGFGGRTINDSNPKYLNSPESLIFQKKNNLYGLNLTRQDINKNNCVILVEGYMDVISLYNKGIRNAAASLGTALTGNQAAMIKRYTDNVIVAYDSDEAGQTATMRALDILYEAGCRSKVLDLGSYKDPDEYIKQNGQTAFAKLIEKAMPSVEYKINLAKKKWGLDSTEGSLNFLKETSEILKKLKSPVEIDTYIKKIALETKISEGAIRLEIYGNNNTNIGNNIIIPKNDLQNTKKERTLSSNDFLEKNLIKLMLVKSDYVPEIVKYKDMFYNQGHQRIVELSWSLYKEDEEIDLAKIRDSLEAEDITLLENIIENVHFSGNEAQTFSDCLNRINHNRLLKRQEEILKLLQVLDEEKDQDKISELTNELIEIHNKPRVK